MPVEQSSSKTAQKRNSVNVAAVFEKIQKCQKEITSFRNRCDKEIVEIEKRYYDTIKPFIRDRNFLIVNVPQFWSTVLLHHPLISSIFEPGETEVIKHLVSLDIEDNAENPDFFKIHFYFTPNPFFENRTLVKEFNEDGSVNTPIKWRTNKQFPILSNHEVWEHDELGMEQKGFFRWFCDSSEQFCDPIADLIKCQVWFDPLEFYFYDRSGEQKKDQQQQLVR